MVDRATFVATVLSYEGTPTLHQGRTPHVAMDCPAPLIVAAWETGLKPRGFDVRGYPRNADGAELKAHCDEHLEPIDWSLAREGDVVLAAWAHDRGRPRHLGIIVERTPQRCYWLHADSRRHRKIVRSRLVFGVDGMRLVQAYRVPGVH